jgi:hypothetical protein
MDWSCNFLIQSWGSIVYILIIWGSFLVFWIVFKILLYCVDDKMKIVNSAFKTIYDLIYNQVIKTWEVH